ncbi:hypothetical protein [Bacillus cereus]|nr:hypothetical protein [Bacillus cereus]
MRSPILVKSYEEEGKLMGLYFDCNLNVEEIRPPSIEFIDDGLI